MLTEQREIAAFRYDGQAHESETWVERVTNPHLRMEYEMQRSLLLQRVRQQAQSLEWTVDSEMPVQVMGKGQQVNAQETKNPLIAYGQVGKIYNEAKKDGVHSWAEAVGHRHQRRKRLEENHRKQHTRKHKEQDQSYGLLGHRKPKEREVLGFHTREEANREQSRGANLSAFSLN